MWFIFVERDLNIIEVHKGRFFFGCIEEILLFVERKSPDWLYGLVIEGLRVYVAVAGVALLSGLFQEQVIGGGDAVVLVGLDAAGGVVRVKAVILQFLQDFLVNCDDVVADNQSGLQGHSFYQFAPRVVVNLSNAVSLGRVHIEHLLNQIFEVFANEIREDIVARENLLVEFSGVVVLEGQIAADHGEEDDSARPDVHLQPVVLLAADHLGRGVAG